MCFKFDQKLTDDLIQKTKDQTIVEMYKFVRINRVDFNDAAINLIAPYQRTKIHLENTLNNVKKDYLQNEEIYYCFHCFDTLEEAKEIHKKVYSWYSDDDSYYDNCDVKIIKIKVKSQDIIAKGYLYNYFHNDCDNVYTSTGVSAYSIDQEEYNQVLNF